MRFNFGVFPEKSSAVATYRKEMHYLVVRKGNFKKRNSMKKIIAILLVGASLAACSTTEKGAGIGALSGAVIGGAVTGNVRGAAVGAALGGVSGAVIGNMSDQPEPDRCYYRDRYGNRYLDYC
jgi:predicted small secreted protein